MSSCEETVSITGETGFSILEVMISLAILMTLLVATSSLLATSFKAGANSRYRQAATEIATSNLDYQVQLGVTTLVGEVGDAALSTVTSNGQTYISEMEISPYTPGNSGACANPNGGLAMLKITVWVTWANVKSGTTWWVSGASGSTGLLVSETTLLSLPSTALNGNDGSILVDVSGVTGITDGIQGVTVSATYSTTTYTTTTTSSGCALFTNLAPNTTWTITASKSGYIDSLDDWTTSTSSATVPTGTANVVPGNVSSVNFTYDQEATVTPTYSVTLTGATPWLPTGISSMPLTFYTSYGTAFPSAGVVLPSPASVFPSNTSPSYNVVTGSCGLESSPAGASLAGATSDGQAVNVTPGGTAAPNFPLTALDIVVSHSGTPVTNANISAAVSASDANCGTGSLGMPPLGLGNTCIPGGPVTTPATSCAALAAFRHHSHGRHTPTGAILLTNCTTSCATTTTLTSTDSSSVYGEPVSFHATVACGPSTCTTLGTPTGSVTFKDGGTTIVGCSGLALSSGVATCTPTNTLSVATHTITAVYAGFNHWNGSTSSNFSQIVAVATTVTTVTSTPNPNSYGTSATLTATVSDSPSTISPTGTVTFKNGATTVCSGAGYTLSAGSVSCTLSGLAGGTYTNITAAYITSNGTDFSNSTSTALTQNVSASTTTTTLTSSSFLNASTFGTSVTLTATVSAASGGPATGTVAFKSNGTAITGCTAQAMTAGVATCTTTTLAAGNDALTAVYTATTPANFATSTGTLTQLVYLEGTTPSIESGLPYGVWILSLSYTPSGGGATSYSTYYMTINTAGIYVGTSPGTLVHATNPIQLTD